MWELAFGYAVDKKWGALAYSCTNGLPSGHDTYKDNLALDLYYPPNTVLGIDPQRLCIWASSGNPPPALKAITDADAAYYNDIRCAVVLYGATERTDGKFPPNFDLLAVRMGKDEPDFYAMMTDLIDWVQE